MFFYTKCYCVLVVLVFEWHIQNGMWLLLSNYNLGFQGVLGILYCSLFKLLVVEGKMHDFFCS
jgi:hypothetical protein